MNGKYRPLRVVGRGAMSVVYEVEHTLTRERLALKVLTGDMTELGLARFRREARISALARSEHIVRVLDADVSADLGGAPFLVMDLLRGRDMATAMASGPESKERIVDWFRQVARGLDHAHAVGVVHRDLKPANLFLHEGENGSIVVKVLDFGVAKFRSEADGSNTTTGAIVGTPLYMSPEQASGADVGPGADMWSVAMCVFRGLCGHDYWTARNAPLLLAQIVSSPIDRPSERGLPLGTAFDDWFIRSCSRQGERWPSVGRQVEALAAALDLPEQPITPPIVGRPPTIGETGEYWNSLSSPGGDSLIASAAEPTSRRRGSAGLLLGMVALAVSLASTALLFRRPAEPAKQEVAPTLRPSIPGVSRTALAEPTPTLPIVERAAEVTAPLATSNASVTSRVPSVSSRRPVSAPSPRPRASASPTAGSSPETPVLPARDPLADPD